MSGNVYMDLLPLDPDPKKLVPELRRCIEHSEVLGPCLKHWLVVQVPFWSATRANELLRLKTERVLQALDDKDHMQVLSVWVERHARLMTLYHWHREGRLRNVAELRRLLAFAWPDTEDPPYREALEMFRHAGYTSDRPKKDKPTGVLTLYRGDSEHRYNIEWSLSRDVAVWFARRYSCPTPVVAKTYVDSRFILGYFAGRQEQEVIVDPDRIKEVTYEDLT